MGQEFGHLFKSLITIEIVCVNDAERFVYLITGRKHGMCGTPRFGTLNLLFDSKRRQIVTLVHVIRLDFSSEFRFEYFLEFSCEFFSDNETYLSESGADSIVDGIIDNRFPIRPERIYLLHASIAAGHTGRKN